MTLKSIKVYYLIIEFSDYMLFYDCNFCGLVCKACKLFLVTNTYFFNILYYILFTEILYVKQYKFIISVIKYPNINLMQDVLKCMIKCYLLKYKYDKLMQYILSLYRLVFTTTVLLKVNKIFWNYYLAVYYEL